MAADDPKPDFNVGYRPGSEERARFDKDLDSWYKRHPDQAPKANQGPVAERPAEWVDGVRRDAVAGSAVKPLGDVSRQDLGARKATGAGAPDPSDPKYSGLAGRAQYNKDRTAYEASHASNVGQVLKKMP